jgi:hypothetical protein
VPDSDELELDAAAVAAEEAVERKETRHVRPWLSGLDVLLWPAETHHPNLPNGIQPLSRSSVACISAC